MVKLASVGRLRSHWKIAPDVAMQRMRMLLPSQSLWFSGCWLITGHCPKAVTQNSNRRQVYFMESFDLIPEITH